MRLFNVTLTLLLFNTVRTQRPPLPPLILLANQRAEDDRLAATASSSTSSTSSCICPLLLRPVCSIDGQTHPNRCVAQCKEASIACEGKCPCPVLEDGPDESEVSGGSEVLNKANCVCQLIYLPVCASDNETSFNNECEAKCHNMEVKCVGTCPCPNTDMDKKKNELNVCRCSDTLHRPVCGINGETYTNECYAACKRVPIQCRTTCPCSFF